MSFSVGVGLTNACDLACAHCYRDVDRVDQLTEAQVLGVCESLPVRSVNLGTGENGLHPEYAAIVRALGARGVKLSLTSNGYTIERSSDETLGAFRELEVSIDFPTAAEQDAFRGVGNWQRVMAGIERVTPRGDVIPCVYWSTSDLRVEDLGSRGAEGVLASPQFAKVRTVPEACRGCPFVATCHGGCAGRRALAGGVEVPDPYCPLVRGERVDLEWAPAARRDLLKTGSACTTVVGPA